MLANSIKAFALVLIFFSHRASAQFNYDFASAKVPTFSVDASNDYSSSSSRRKLYQRNTGMILGLQKGKYTSIELGGEAHWRKIAFRKPHITGATANLEYDFQNHVLGYKAGLWRKTGRVNLTYGANVSYFTNFNEGNRFGFGPTVGFRLLGLHLVNGFNILTKDKTSGDEKPIEVNSLYMSLRYYFPVKNDFTWDRKTMKKKKDRRKARAKRQKEKEKQRESGDNKSFWNIFKKSDKASND
jgi:hypothetical protein